jgi:hypothetical protein
MPTSKRTTQRKTTPKPKAQEPKKAPVPQTLGELKKKFAADRKASPENDAALRAEYLKNKKALQEKK